MYGGEIIFLIVGIILLILNICIIVKFFQIAKNVERLTNLYVYGVVERVDGKIEYYKTPLIRDDEKLEKIEKERQERKNIDTATAAGYYSGLK